MVCPANRSSNISVTGIRFRRSNIPTTTRFEWVGGPHNLAQRTHGAQQFGARPPARRLRGGRPHNRQPPGPTGVPASCPRDGGFHRLPARLGNARQHHLGQTVHERKQGLLGSPVVSENRIARWAMRERLSTCKGMVEAVWDGENRKSGAHRKRDAGPPKRIPPEPQPQQQKDRQKIQQRIPTLCSTTRCLAVWERLPCWWVLQSVANCFRRPPTTETVADCSQTVAIGCKPRKSADAVSRVVCAIPFLR